MSESESIFKATIREMAKVLCDPANRAPCVDCEGQGYLLMPLSLKRRPCGECYGEGTVLIRNPFTIETGAALGGEVFK